MFDYGPVYHALVSSSDKQERDRLLEVWRAEIQMELQREEDDELGAAWTITAIRICKACCQRSKGDEERIPEQGGT